MDLKIQQLLVLQEKDERIFNLLQLIKQVPNDQKKAQEEVQQAEERHNNAKLRIRQIQQQIQACEEEIKKIKDQITQLNVKASSCRDNNEFRSIMGQIEELKKKIDAQEDKELDLMESIETAKQTQEQLAKELEAIRKRVSLYCQDLEQRKKNCESQLETIKKEREQVVSELPEEYVRRYERLIHFNRNAPFFKKVVVPLVDECCSSCHLRIPPDQRNKVKAGKEICYCDNCGAFLYIQD